MKCIDKSLIQAYIDNELDSETKLIIETHLSKCKDCTQKVEKQRNLSSYIKTEIDGLTNSLQDIPDYTNIINAADRAKNPKRNVRKYIYAVSGVAACILAFCLIIFLNKPEPEKIVYYYSLEYGEFDANKPFSEQELNIVIFDSEGRKLIN